MSRRVDGRCAEASPSGREGVPNFNKASSTKPDRSQACGQKERNCSGTIPENKKDGRSFK